MSVVLVQEEAKSGDRSPESESEESEEEVRRDGERGKVGSGKATKGSLEIKTPCEHPHCSHIFCHPRSLRKAALGATAAPTAMRCSGKCFKFSSLCFAQHSMPGSIATSWVTVDVLSSPTDAPCLEGVGARDRASDEASGTTMHSSLAAASPSSALPPIHHGLLAIAGPVPLRGAAS